jgi:hypothetical protein
MEKDSIGKPREPSLSKLHEQTG